MQGRVVITKTSPTNSVATFEDSVPVNVMTPPGASCTPSTQTVATGQSVTVIGSPSGEAPVSCSYAGGGTPATSASCSPFTTTYNTTGTKTITFTVNAANGPASCQSTVNVVATVPPDATLYTAIGTTTPYTRSLSGDDPINNVDASLAANILSGCGSSADANINKCSVRYRLDCTRNGTWEGDFTYSNVSNEPKGYLFDNTCSYSGAGTYYLRGQITVTKNSDPTAVKVVTEDIPIFVVDPNDPNNNASASCDPSSISIQTNQQVTIDGNVGGNGPTCSWSGGGTPATSNSCSPFQTTFTSSAGSPRTITLNVTAANGSTAQCTANVTVTDPPPVDIFPLDAVRNGQGTITSDIPGINCGGTCRGNYDEGTTVVLTAMPADGWSFIEWEWDDTPPGCSSVLNNTCTVEVNGPREVTAKFRPNTLYEEF
ncbi:MAG: hypothetical protein COU08_01985 [Candidatus Harrisonbacteria bacterium CG10_big_fil_rev_8_21_14_0_10_42_17]|uniref:PKD/Chitinase domain-containing protein n=1 Tax=Candidatus Harrisonbacteria bacterium CG10_big_fil_rev_8_21_14_0_10_42_17 TaxID=1974584 RepID=A0A2M6WID3_9BACT|nr:MAG: hypothetical protein COU08_01985 [Candidatus Harrisonbacteria bacterium CG10_big_fil_rev_8_21_14_0_10_42_17]